MSLESPSSCCVYLLVVLWDFRVTHFDRVHSFNPLLYSTLPCPPKIKPSRPMWAIVSIWRLRKIWSFLKGDHTQWGFWWWWETNPWPTRCQTSLLHLRCILDCLRCVSFSSLRWPPAFWLWFFPSCKCCHQALAQSDSSSALHTGFSGKTLRSVAARVPHIHILEHLVWSAI